MNDIEKAIEILKMENELMQFDPNTGEDYPIELQNQDNQDLYKANLIAITALEKQISKDFAYDEIGLARCGSCKSYVDESEYYCSHCGQRIAW